MGIKKRYLIRTIVFFACAACGNMFPAGAAAQAVKVADSSGQSYSVLRDDMKSYQVICGEYGRIYGDYYKTVREKITRRLKRNYMEYGDGDVELFFVLNSNGSLARIDLDLGNSTKDRRLIDTALSSLQDAAPFPHFPKELDNRQLPFSVTISFKEK